MSIDRSSPDLDRPDRAALEAVAAARAAVLRGLVHALSNRVGTVGAVAAMLEPEAPAAGAPARMLQDEAARLEGLLEEFRRFAGESLAEPEPLFLPELLALAVALHAHHPALRDVPCEVAGADVLPPALAEPTAVVDALLVALDAAKRAAGEGGVRVAGEADATTIVLRVRPVAAPHDDAPATVGWPLPGGMGRAEVGASGGTVRLPTLAAGRG